MAGREALRVWGLPLLVLAVLPVAAVVVRAVVPPIGTGIVGGDRERGDGQRATGNGHGGAGFQACAGCHPSETSAWAGSNHAAAERELTEDDPGPLRMVGRDQKEAEFTPHRAIGVQPLVQYLVAGERGRFQVGQSAWDPEKREWFDVFDDGRLPGEWGHWTGAAMTWNSQCASCHTTGLDKGWTEATDSYATTWDGLGVQCASCHGDQVDHAAGGTATELDAGAIEGVCASCHSRRAELTGDFVAGAGYLDHYAPILVDPTDTYWPDGQVREEDFESVAFSMSRMHAAGVQCASCHDPHSGGLRSEGDAVCLDCHALMVDFAEHDPHEQEVGCVACHMPVTTYMQRHPRHDHSFQIPDPWLEVEHGIPSACGRCHDEGAEWELVAAERWWGSGEGPRRARVDALARAKAGDATSVPAVLAVLRDDPAAPWRAAAAGMLVLYADLPEVTGALVAALADPDPLVRFVAAGALDPTTEAAASSLDTMLNDPVRAVRVAAARSLRDRLTPEATLAKDYAAYLAYNSDQPAALHERGTWYLEHGRTGRAITDLERAASLDPGSPAHHDSLAVAYATGGRHADAARALAQAVALAPDDAELHYRYALARAGTGDLAGAETSLTKAVELAPQNARAWTNLAIVKKQLGRPDARDAARRAVELAPDDERAKALLGPP